MHEPHPMLDCWHVAMHSCSHAVMACIAGEVEFLLSLHLLVSPCCTGLPPLGLPVPLPLPCGLPFYYRMEEISPTQNSRWPLPRVQQPAEYTRAWSTISVCALPGLPPSHFNKQAQVL